MKHLLFFVLLIIVGCNSAVKKEAEEIDCDNNLNDLDVLDDSDVESDIYSFLPSPLKPAPLQIPDWEECPEGWIYQELSSAQTIYAKYCEPEIEESECGGLEKQSIGKKGCEKVFSAEKITDFSEKVEVNNGDSLSLAIEKAKDNALIVLGEGVFEGIELNSKKITISGTSPDKTWIISKNLAGDKKDAVIKVGKDGLLTLVNIGISGEKGGISLSDNGSLKSSGIIITETKGFGISLNNQSSGTVQDSYLYDISSYSDQTEGYGIKLEGDSVLAISKTTINRAKTAGITTCTKTIPCSASVQGSIIIIQNTQPQESDNNQGRGAAFYGYGKISLEKIVVENNFHSGIIAQGPFEKSKSLDFTASYIVIRNTVSNKMDNSMGYGIVFAGNVKGVLNKGVVDSNQRYGAAVLGDDLDNYYPQGSFMDIIIKNSKPDNTGSLGEGIFIQYNSLLTIKKAFLSDNFVSGIAVYGNETLQTKTTFIGEDIRIINTKSGASGLDGSGITLFNNSISTLSRINIQNCESYGMQLSYYPESNDKYFINHRENKTVLNVSDIIVENSLPRPIDKNGGVGLIAHHAAEVSISKGEFKNNLTAGILLEGDEGFPVVMKADNLAVLSTKKRVSDNDYGIGIAVQKSSSLFIQNSLVDDSETAGIVVISKGSSNIPALRASSFSVKNTKPRACFYSNSCLYFPEVPMGYGIAVAPDAVANLKDIELYGNETGLTISSGKVFSEKPCRTINNHSDICLSFLKNKVALSAGTLPENYELDKSLGECYYFDNFSDYSGDEQKIPKPVESKKSAERF